MTLAFPCASLCMMYALERFGRKPTSIVSFVLAGAFAVAFVNATSDTMLLAVGFCMIFFIQLAGNSMQIFASEVFSTNARASGFGFAQGAGRLGTAFIIPAILWIQTGYGAGAVSISVAAKPEGHTNSFTTLHQPALQAILRRVTHSARRSQFDRQS